MKIGIENEDLMKQFKLTVTLPQQEDKKLRSITKRKGEGAWNHLGLSHSVSWPLHILFTPTILEKYVGKGSGVACHEKFTLHVFLFCCLEFLPYIRTKRF